MEVEAAYGASVGGGGGPGGRGDAHVVITISVGEGVRGRALKCGHDSGVARHHRWVGGEGPLGELGVAGGGEGAILILFCRHGLDIVPPPPRVGYALEDAVGDGGAHEVVLATGLAPHEEREVVVVEEGAEVHVVSEQRGERGPQGRDYKGPSQHHACDVARSCATPRQRFQTHKH